MNKKAIVLLSGGLDSTTCLAVAKDAGFDCYGLSFYYNQKQSAEIVNARKIAREFGVIEHRISQLPMGDYGGSALTDQHLEIPDYSISNDIPVTYVPARNTVFIAMALSWGEVIGAYDIFYGANVIDYSNYPDCRPEYIEAFERLADLATKAGVEGTAKFKIHAPLLHLNKTQIIQLGLSLKIDYSKTVSCYRANEKGEACGKCLSCGHRKKGFDEAGIQDPTIYAGNSR